MTPQLTLKIYIYYTSYNSTKQQFSSTDTLFNQNTYFPILIDLTHALPQQPTYPQSQGSNCGRASLSRGDPQVGRASVTRQEPKMALRPTYLYPSGEGGGGVTRPVAVLLAQSQSLALACCRVQLSSVVVMTMAPTVMGWGVAEHCQGQPSCLGHSSALKKGVSDCE